MVAQKKSLYQGNFITKNLDKIYNYQINFLYQHHTKDWSLYLEYALGNTSNECLKILELMLSSPFTKINIRHLTLAAQTKNSVFINLICSHPSVNSLSIDKHEVELAKALPGPLTDYHLNLAAKIKNVDLKKLICSHPSFISLIIENQDIELLVKVLKLPAVQLTEEHLKLAYKTENGDLIDLILSHPSSISLIIKKQDIRLLKSVLDLPTAQLTEEHLKFAYKNPTILKILMEHKPDLVIKFAFQKYSTENHELESQASSEIIGADSEIYNVDLG